MNSTTIAHRYRRNASALLLTGVLVAGLGWVGTDDASAAPATPAPSTAVTHASPTLADGPHDIDWP